MIKKEEKCPILFDLLISHFLKTTQRVYQILSLYVTLLHLSIFTLLLVLTDEKGFDDRNLSLIMIYPSLCTEVGTLLLKSLNYKKCCISIREDRKCFHSYKVHFS